MSTTTAVATAVAYERISRFRVSERGVDAEVERGVDRQAADNVRAAESLGLGTIRRHYVDNNRSASQYATREREQWLALLDDVRAGGVTHVLVWLLDRIVRDTDDLSELLAACKASGAVIVQTATGSTIDPTNPESVLHAKISGAVAEYETAKMSMRIRRQKESAAMQGRPHGGKRWFGYEDGNMTPDAIEAPIYRDLVARFLGGETLHSLAAWLTREGVPTVMGGTWSGSNLAQMLAKPRYAGRRIHRGEDVGEGAWPALVDEATHASLVHKLGDPGRRTNAHVSNARVYLLAGLAVCASCGAPLRGFPIRPGRSGADYGTYTYACSTGRHVHKSGTHVDAVVEGLVVARLQQSDVSGALVDDDALDEARALRADRDAARARLDALADDYAEGKVSAAAYGKATARVEAILVDLDERLGAASERAKAPVAILDGMTGEHAQAAWDAADLGRRRALVGLVCSRVAVHGGRGPVKPESVEVEWR